jgi:hypothetical protein
MKSSTWRTIAFCLASGIICGLLNAARCPGGTQQDVCAIAALQAFSSADVDWRIWLDWINWVPGLVFGLMLWLSHLGWMAGRRRPLITFALASAVIYLIAGPLFTGVLVWTQDMDSLGFIWLLPAGFAAGLFGGLGLALATNLVKRASLAAKPLSRIGLPAVVGGGAGMLFVLVCFFGAEAILAAWPAAFVIWQVPVGLALMRRTAGSDS